jgi:hypothetical protein
MAGWDCAVKRRALSRGNRLVYGAAMSSHGTSKDARAERLAAALRANLKKRKLVERGIGADPGGRDETPDNEGAPPSAGSAPSA